jgi:hypothetical protein
MIIFDVSCRLWRSPLNEEKKEDCRACGIPSHLGNPATDHHETPVGNAINTKTGTKQAMTRIMEDNLVLCTLIFILGKQTLCQLVLNARLQIRRTCYQSDSKSEPEHTQEYTDDYS